MKIKHFQQIGLENIFTQMGNQPMLGGKAKAKAKAKGPGQAGKAAKAARGRQRAPEDLMILL